MTKIIMYTTGFCPYCKMAENLLRSKGVKEIEMIRVDLDPEQRLDMVDKTGRRTVPQIYIGDKHIGGYDDLARLWKTTIAPRVLTKNIIIAARGNSSAHWLGKYLDNIF